jgi:predicted phosphodiesterase
MNRRNFLLKCLISGGFMGATKWFGLDLFTEYVKAAEGDVPFGEKGYYRIVVLGDPHLPVREREVKDTDKRQRILEAKDSVIDDINYWQDVDEVTVLGDIAAQFGNETEYGYAKEYFGRLVHPVYIISGNHDYVYEDAFSPKGKFVLGDTASRQLKLKRFKETFGLQSLFYGHQAGPYQLIYLSPDSLEHYLTAMSEEEIDWLRGQLAQHVERPTIIFFHAPLQDTLLSYNKTANTPDFVAQPVNVIDDILRENPQVRLWVSGHTHTPATNESYASDEINTYKGCIRNIHTPDMDRETIWTNSLYLYPDKIVIRTFNHNTKEWEEALERTIPLNGAGRRQ